MGAEGASPTRRKRDPERRRQEIVRAATEMLLEGSTLSHRAVAQRAGVPLGATTYYFSSLHDLREAAVCQLAEEVTVELTDLAEQVAAADLRTAIALLDLRHIAGDAQLVEDTAARVRARWRREARRRVGEVVDLAADRDRRYGSLAHATEPNLKSDRGGLRDITVIRALAARGRARAPGAAGGLRRVTVAGFHRQLI